MTPGPLMVACTIQTPIYFPMKKAAGLRKGGGFKKPTTYQRKILGTACHRPCTDSALRGLQRSPVAHMKALNAISS
jgi:hypothetical protein